MSHPITQTQLFPLHVSSTCRPPRESADLSEYARTRDGHDWAVKWPEDGKGIAASEWFGYRLAGACQIATPFSAVLVDAAGRLGFGSRIEGASSQFTRLPAKDKFKALESCRQAMSAVIALDIFCGNTDRHLDNWIFVKNTAESWVPMCIDFSRALLAAGFPDDHCPMTACHTLTTQARLKASDNWDGPFATFCVDALQSISQRTVEQWLTDCPNQWVTTTELRKVVDWWGSKEYHARLQKTLNQL